MSSKKGLFLSLVLILSLGLTTVWSTAPQLFWAQFTFICLGILLAFLLTRLDPRLLFGLSPLLYLLSLALLVLTLVFGQSIRGASRWLVIAGFNLQASEMVKPLLAIFFADLASRWDLNQTRNLISYLILAALPIGLVKIQPDLGSALVLTALAGVILLASGLSKTKPLILAGIFLFLLPLAPKLLKPYQMERLEAFVNPYHDPQGSGYNVIQSVIAIGSGSWFGKGVRLGTQSHLNFLPERHTDFVFASFAEEFGFLGTTLILLAYFYLLFRLLNLARELRHDPPLYFLSLGIFSIFTFQVVVNLGMNLGLLPVTGITLPLFSYGGSSILSFFILLGLTLGLLELTPRIKI